MALVLHPEKAAAIREAYDTAEVLINQADETRPDGGWCRISVGGPGIPLTGWCGVSLYDRKRLTDA